MSKRVWIHGPIAIDTVLYLPRFPEPGSFMQAVTAEDRTGGTSANVALGLATTDIETGFIGYVGKDDNGKKLKQAIAHSRIAHSVIYEIDEPTSHVLILVDDKSERTIIGMTRSHLRSLRIGEAPLKSGDILVFVLWREEFLEDLIAAQKLGCICVLGAAALADPRIESAELIIGSHSDFSADVDMAAQLRRFDRVVITKGMEGATEYSKKGAIFQGVFPARAVDATGAGDSFLAGYLTGFASGLASEESLAIGAQWAASAVEVSSSIPPAWKDVKERWSILKP